jgi:hypothetical protein
MPDSRGEPVQDLRCAPPRCSVSSDRDGFAENELEAFRSVPGWRSDSSTEAFQRPSNGMPTPRWYDWRLILHRFDADDGQGLAFLAFSKGAGGFYRLADHLGQVFSHDDIGVAVAG